MMRAGLQRQGYRKSLVLNPFLLFCALEGLCYVIAAFSGYHIQSTLDISNPKEHSEILRDIRTSTYQICRIEEKNNSNNHI